MLSNKALSLSFDVPLGQGLHCVLALQLLPLLATFIHTQLALLDCNASVTGLTPHREMGIFCRAQARKSQTKGPYL